MPSGYIWPASNPAGSEISAHGALQRARWHYPTTAPDGVSIGDTVLLYCHGAGGSDTELSLAGWSAMLTAWLAAGHVAVEAWAGFDDSGDLPANNWGNDLGRSEYEKAWAEMADRYPATRTVVMGRSMGGLCAAWLATQSTVLEGVVAAVFSSAVVSLANAFTNNVNEHAAKILQAYDVDAYAEVPAGHDPNLFTGSAWAGLRTRWYYGLSDTTVPPAQHVEVVAPIVAAHALEASLVPVAGGNHSSVSVYQASADLASWLDGDPPPTPEPTTAGIVDAHGLPVRIVDATGTAITT